jgi:hypothetical protein
VSRALSHFFELYPIARPSSRLRAKASGRSRTKVEAHIAVAAPKNLDFGKPNKLSKPLSVEVPLNLEKRTSPFKRVRTKVTCRRRSVALKTTPSRPLLGHVSLEIHKRSGPRGFERDKGHDYDKNLKLDALTGNIYDVGTRQKC